MKRIILFILLFFSAVAISPLLINEKGYILIAMGDLTIESTVVTATIMLILTFIALVLSLKLVKGSLRFSLAGWNKIAFASKRRGMKDLNRGIAAFIFEDHQQAEHLLVKAAEPSQFERISYLMAAAAASKQALRSNTNHYLSLLAQQENSVKSVGLETTLVTIKLLILQEDYEQARALIDEHHKHIGHDARLLSLEIELSLLEQRFDYVVEQLVAARKQKTINSEKIALWEATAFSGVFNEKITKESQEALAQYWQNLSRKLKQNEAILLAYCHVLAKHKITAPLTKILLPAFKKGGDDAFIKSTRTLPLSSVDELISATQKHLHKSPHSAKWLSALAHLSTNSQQWLMAEKAFNSLVHLEGEQYDKLDLQVFATVLAQQGEHQKANEVLLKIIS
jgi:HemY protein